MRAAAKLWASTCEARRPIENETCYGAAGKLGQPQLQRLEEVEVEQQQVEGMLPEWPRRRPSRPPLDLLEGPRPQAEYLLEKLLDDLPEKLLG
mmetsp:Transcript_59984/g.155774  ORF Transcript_59984/g.155774 Transcript_59984/m.155774 type:complete len:93 (+) Transcript_59984:239-517(+)